MATHAAKLRAPRRHWPLSEKRRIVELSLNSSRSTRSIAREQGVHPTSLQQWKTLYRSGKLEPRGPARRGRRSMSSAVFVPVSVAPTVHTVQKPARRDVPAGSSSSVVQLVLASGVTLRIESDGLDTALVCALVAELRR